MGLRIFGHGKGDGGLILTTNDNYTPPPGYTDEEARQIAGEWKQREGVYDARPVTFAGITHVHVDLYAENGMLGDIIVQNPEKEIRIEMEPRELTEDDMPEPERPWWKFW